MLGQAVLKQDELLTTVTEVEAIFNSRPIFYVSTEDIEEPQPHHVCLLVEGYVIFQTLLKTQMSQASTNSVTVAER